MKMKRKTTSLNEHYGKSQENEEMAENETDRPFFHFLILHFLSKAHYRAYGNH